MNNENTKKYINLPPFKGWVLENFPFIEEDFDAITNYQMMCKIIGYLNVIKDNNDYIQNEEIKPLYDAFVSLKEYVDNYFDNLDIQAEVDAKLDEMAESGELAEIIAQYLQVNAVLGFNTKSDLKSAENLIDGSITRTIGTDTYNDGKGHYYKIRTITSGDVIDDDNILALSNYPTLIAEKIQDYEINNIYDILDNITETTIPAIQEDLSALGEEIPPLETKIDDEIENRITNEQTIKSLVTIGDSYGVMDGTTNWCSYIKQYLNLSNDNFFNNSYGGTGFAHPNDNKTFTTLVNECSTLLSEERRNAVTHVLIAGGYNDQWSTDIDIINGVISCITACHSVFPNAKIFVAHIGWSTNNSDLFHTFRNYYEGTCQTKYAKFIINSQNILRADLISNDNVHPTNTGLQVLAKNLIMGLQVGSCYPLSGYVYLKDTSDNNMGVIWQENGIFAFELYESEFTYNGTANGNEIAYKTLASNSLISGHNCRFSVPCMFVNSNNNEYVMGTCLFIIDQRNVKLKPTATNSGGNNYMDFTSIRFSNTLVNILHSES